jgi:Zn-dependent protease with chaperone function
VNAVDAWFYDGRTPRRQAARLIVADGEVVATGEFGIRKALLADLEISEPMGGAPRTLRFPDGALLEVPDGPAMADWLREAGVADSTVVRLQTRWHWALGALVASVVLIAAFYVWGLPMVSRVVAERMPQSVSEALSRQTLALLDDRMLSPSKLPEERQKALAQHIDAYLGSGGSIPAYRLHFRASEIGPNAFALPSGDVVVFDELVKLAKSDDEVAAVIAHELGHVVYRHGMRQLIQSSVVSFVVGVYFGDVSSVASGLAALALASNYSREFERQADDYGVWLIRHSRHDPEALAVMLDRLEAAYAKAHVGESARSMLASHPETAERVRRIRESGVSRTG